MEENFKLATPIASSLYDYIGTLGNELYNLNHAYVVQSAYNYCTELAKEELDSKMGEVAKKYYKLLLNRKATKLVKIKTKESMQPYYANNLIMLYILVFLHDHEEVFGITEENRFSV